MLNIFSLIKYLIKEECEISCHLHQMMNLFICQLVDLKNIGFHLFSTPKPQTIQMTISQWFSSLTWQNKSTLTAGLRPLSKRASFLIMFPTPGRMAWSNSTSQSILVLSLFTASTAREKLNLDEQTSRPSMALTFCLQSSVSLGKKTKLLFPQGSESLKAQCKAENEFELSGSHWVMTVRNLIHHAKRFWSGEVICLRTALNKLTSPMYIRIKCLTATDIQWRCNLIQD